MNKIPFNKPLILGSESEYLKQVFDHDQFSGNGYFSKKCNELLENKTGCRKAIMTSSCTDALEMTALLSDIQPGDEVIMPSFTFVTTASAFELRKANIVWCDIRPDTKNIDENKIEELITSRTKAVVVVHYGGVGCEMDKISEICKKHRLIIIEDDAQGIDCSYKGKPLGSIGDMAAVSFHETKNIQCGEGGALLVNNPCLVEKAEFIRDKGTNRIHFNKGIVDKYTWIELGSSFLMSELQAAFLYPQLQRSVEVNKNRLISWELYYSLLSEFISQQNLPVVPEYCTHNAHMFYMICRSNDERTRLIDHCSNNGIGAIFHYVPLHKAPYWKGKYDGVNLEVTDEISSRLLRLPMFYGITADDIRYVCSKIKQFYKG
ncbi:MAG TPA: dTDP-4-amino-4,6-dideoxygalactose transaminase [Clostridiales bacterium]|nr:dTDP-4-amino-4,6-dideoxygalactose transaminase [Clostridiales bacterium]HQP69961.1 dTDP-4-amino-4,6-dideoxygalactose transaminase [Clostridiales bacterium]